jgi:hypothetical protein
LDWLALALILISLGALFFARRSGLTYRSGVVRVYLVLLVLGVVAFVALILTYDPDPHRDDAPEAGAETTTTAPSTITEPVVVGEVGEVTNPHALLEPAVIRSWFVKADDADTNAADALAKEVPGMPAPANGRYVVVTFQVAATGRSGVPATPADVLDVAITDAAGEPLAPCPFELPGPSLSAPLSRTHDVVGVRACADATPEQADGARFAVTVQPDADNPSGPTTVYWATS